MKTVDRIVLLTFIVILMTACSSALAPTPAAIQGDNPYAPQPADADMQRDGVTIDSASLSLTKSQPPQVLVNFAYFPPTPCHQLRVEVSGPGPENRIDITAYSVTEKEKACVLMALATPLPAGLKLGSFPGGHYSLWLNGVKVGEFDS